MPNDLSGRVLTASMAACASRVSGTPRGAEPLVIRKVIGGSELCGTNRNWRKVIGEIYDESDEPELRYSTMFVFLLNPWP
jgi:hypothetical protein